MSVKIMGQVWELDLPHNKLLVLLAMADHADHTGRKVFPSLSLIAWKTGYSLAQVRRIVAALRRDKILIPEKERKGKTTVYRIDTSAAKHKIEFNPAQNDLGQNDTPSKMSDHPAQNERSTPIIAMTHEPSVTIIEASIEPNGTFTDLIKAWLDSSKSVQSNPYGNKTNRKQAIALHETGITAQDVTDYITELLKQPFWQQQGVKFDKVANGIRTWKDGRTANGHEPDTLISQWDTDNEPIQQGVDYT